MRAGPLDRSLHPGTPMGGDSLGVGMKGLAGRIILLWGWRRFLAAFMAGALAVLTQAPYDFFAAGFVSFPVLVWLIDGATADSPSRLLGRLSPAFAVGWWFGFGYFVAGLWWVGGALLVEAESFAWALPLAVLALPAAMAVFWGLAAALARLLWSGGLGRIAALAAAFGIAEWLRAVAFTGFPWNPIGFAAMPVPLLMQSVSVVGVTGMNALAVFVFSVPALLADRRGLRPGLAIAALLVAAHVGFGLYRLALADAGAAGGRELSVRIVQPDILQTEKWEGSVRDRIFKAILDLSSAPAKAAGFKPDLILWPETSVPFLFTERPDGLAAIGESLADGQLLLAGAVRQEGAEGTNAGARYYNSVVAVDDKGEIVDAVDKVHLVPFGEYLPFEDDLAEIGIEKIVPFPMSFSAGAKRHPLIVDGSLRAVPFVCYEIIFPDLVDRDTAEADVVVNVTNDAWFGDTPGPYQHFRQAQVRAVETGLPLIRAANTGISGVVDSHGRIVDALAMNVSGVIDVTLRLSQDTLGQSLRQARRLIGPVILLLLVVFAFSVRVRQRLRAN